ncbi:coiled-coil domain-containing protein 18 [Hypomesus transpacificus]|uniref:coiled-coil domain-containing protein 18 n=1 Tax=Hypomesus transpacificus TaxID=137520 RepID=UPI001F075B7C|nr:coiled-coil domain-containing protein 18 [Hypomesus transpacificus]
MASCLVPDFPAVQIALEHLGELDKLLNDEGVPFSPEASQHLKEIAAAITELEDSRRSAHERLEVETIETSKIRHQVQNMRVSVSEEIAAGVAAARDSNAAQILQLQEELNGILQETESNEKKHELLGNQNAILFPERELVKGLHEEVIDQLNFQLSEKANKHIVLNETLNKAQDVRDKISTVEETRLELEQDMVQERLIFNETKENLQKEVEESITVISEQKKNNAKIRKVLDVVNSEVLDNEDRVTELQNNITQLEHNIGRLTAAETQCKEQLKEEINKCQELVEQKTFHDRDLVEVREAFELKVQSLHEEILVVDSDMEKAQTVNGIFLASITKLSDSFKAHRKEEDEVMAEHLIVSRRLEKSRQRLEERIASIAKYKIEMREMEDEIKQLLEANIVNEDLFQRNQEELHGQLSKEKKSIAMYEVEKEGLCQSLDKLKRDHEHYVKEINADITTTRERYTQLRQEEEKLQEHLHMSSVIEKLKNEVVEAEENYEHVKISLKDQTLQLIVEAEEVTLSSQTTAMELEDKTKILEEVEAQFDVDQSRHQNLMTQTSDMKTTHNNLELSIQEIKEQTSILVQPKEIVRKQLAFLREKHMGTLKTHAAEISTTENSIYENGVKLEQVNMENSRLHLCIEQMKEDLADARSEKERHIQDIGRLNREELSLFGRLLEAWQEDTVVTEESAERDQKLLEAIHSLMLKIQDRKGQLGKISSQLEQQLHDMNSLLVSASYTKLKLSKS